MFNLFWRGKGIGSEIVSMADMDQDVRPSLFVGGRLSSTTGLCMTPAIEVVRWGYLDEVGFATNWSSSLSGRPPRKEELRKNFYSDRFFNVTPRKKQEVLARVEIKEAPVYDERYRCPIDFTGFEVIVTLHEEAFGPFVEYVGLPAPESKDHDQLYFRDFALRVPSATFPFPEQRGGPSPYNPVGKYVTNLNLKVIRKFEVDDLTVVKVDGRERQTNLVPGAPFQERYSIQSGLRLVFSSC